MILPTWLLLALISPFFWGIVHVLDSHCVEEVFDTPWIGSVASSLTLLSFFPFLSMGLVWADSSRLSYQGALECTIAGALYAVSQVLYFRALAITESGIVAAYWNMLPLLLLVISYLLLGEGLSIVQYAGSALLILGSVLFCLVDSNLDYRWHSLFYMFLGSCFQAAYFLLVDHAFLSNSVYPSFLITSISMIVFGMTPLLFSTRRKLFCSNWPRIWTAAKFLLAIECANLAAVITSQYAIDGGPVSLVATVEATIPAYTMMISFVLYVMFRRYGEAEARNRLPEKLLLTVVMVVGVWMVS